MDQEPLRAVQRVDDAAHLVGFLDGQQLGLSPRGDEGEHHHVGVGIEEDVLDELLSIAERMIATGGPDEVSLHIEHELPTREPFLGELGIDSGALFQLVAAAGSARGGIGGVESQKSRGRAAG